jgi:large subunit ribosomal protein L6e
LTHPIRISLLNALDHEEKKFVGELSAEIGIEQAIISQQQAAHRKAKWIIPHSDKKFVFYSIHTAELLKISKARRQRLSTANKNLKLSKNWYPVSDAKKHFVRKSKAGKTARLRKDITPGQVLIVLSGRFRGRRVVFLKALKSNLLLVTGPYKLNGVPLKRVNQAYTLSTSTKVDIKGVDASKINDALFKKDAKAHKAGENKFFADSAKKSTTSEERKTAQKGVDAAILKNIKESKEPLLRKYLGSRFSLANNDKVHELHF